MLLMILNGTIASNRLVVWSLEGKLTAKALSSVEIPSGTVFLGTSSRHSHVRDPEMEYESF
ncbi:hypothetical protein FRC18_006352 [Serendipita sp. 400]|nr:hypothetical protein FRC18_006352 [Serendipita sp. 400]